MPVPGEILEALEREAARSLSFWRRLTAPQLLVGSFLGLISFGTLLLLVLPGLYTGPPLHFIDALFTATSAVCVTGLIVVDTATYFTPWGQGVVLLLIQLGGLGILTLTTLVIMVVGGRPSIRSEAVVGVSDALPHINAGRLLRSIIIYTFVIEGVGAVVLYAEFASRLGAGRAAWHAVFHAVSAFCNAGFSTFSNSLMDFAGDPVILLVVAGLIVLGGLGFLVLEELHLTFGHSGRRRLSLHSKLVLLTTAILIVGGTLLILTFEWRNGLSRFPWYVRPLEALFMSITPRTAGFNTVDYSQLTAASLFLSIGLMMIGGSPGSTAGGLKTTTAAVLTVLATSRMRGKEHPAVFGRTLPEGTLQRSVGLVVFVMAMLGGAILLLQITEVAGVPASHTHDRFLGLTFEAVSAFNTVGLSTGLTAGLSTAGKVILVLLMFIGRVGPLTIIASMVEAARRRPAHFRYATEDVVIG